MSVLASGTECVVAPLAGARIEIQQKENCYQLFGVAPLAGARIEITSTRDVYMQEQLVAPLAGARIEIYCRRRCIP